MPYTCCVVGCRGNYRNEPKVHLFKFPNDQNLCDRWVSIIDRLNFSPTKHSRVCQVHFPPEKLIWTSTAQDSVTGYSVTVNLSKPKLAPDAVPTLFPEQLTAAARGRSRKRRREHSVASVPPVSLDSVIRVGVVEPEPSDMDCEMLIGEVYARRQLWDMLHPHHHHRGVLDKTWTEISDNMGISVKDARQKWKYLRDQFRRELRKLKGSAEKGGITYDPTWPYFTSLLFLKDQMMGKERDDSPSPQSLSNYFFKVENDFEEVENSLVTLEEEEEEIMNPHKRSRSSDTIKTEVQDQKKQEGFSDDYHFFMSLLPAMSKFNDLQKMRLRSKFQQAIVEELCQMEEYQQVASSSSFEAS